MIFTGIFILSLSLDEQSSCPLYFHWVTTPTYISLSLAFLYILRYITCMFGMTNDQSQISQQVDKQPLGSLGQLHIEFLPYWNHSQFLMHLLLSFLSSGVWLFIFRQHDDYHGHIIVNQHSPLLTTTEAQLNEDNEDFSQRKPYHQSELRPGEELPLLCDEDK